MFRNSTPAFVTLGNAEDLGARLSPHDLIKYQYQDRRGDSELRMSPIFSISIVVGSESILQKS